MAPDEYLAALRAAGLPDGLPARDMDRRAAELLGITERTARRYRTAKYVIPKHIEVTLGLLAKGVAQSG